MIGNTAYLDGCTFLEDEVLVGPHASISAAQHDRPRRRDCRGAVFPRETRGALPPLALGVLARVSEDTIEPDRWAAGGGRYLDQAQRYRREPRRLD